MTTSENSVHTTGELPVAIVGAGPAGLSAARALKRLGIPYVQFERHSDVGGIWDLDNPGTPMYRSAHFISSRDKSGFYGFPMPKDFADYPSREQILRYTRMFADEFGLRDAIHFNAPVTAVEQGPDEVWRVRTATGETLARAVVCASGVTWDPLTPTVQGTFDGEIMHSVEYVDPSLFRGRRVLVVGLGNSGADIACDAAGNADAAFISARRGYHFVPKHTFGMPSDQTEWLPIWAERLSYTVIRPVIIGDVSRWGLKRPDHRLFESHPLLNTQLLHHLQHGDVIAKPGVAHFDGGEVVFTDGSRERVDLILFATGYRMSIPYAPDDYFPWKGGRPQLYLNAFSRERHNLFGLGYLETNSSAYTLFDRIAHLITQYLDDQRHRPERARRFEALIRADHPDLSGGINFVGSDRHAAYIEVRAYKKYLRKLQKRMDWTEPSPGMFDAIRAERRDKGVLDISG
ncbi:NAD(P)-binding domain-containing protein [Streptomyces sp. NBC_00481]|uniref:flavin-containing monooxygenase n=1 Tax=Streptomyces sp. NBC_00481 TaxID=2975755 RepID=UPI002DDBD6A8|nr:NAD(P)-binding domain-containing protein [Streptomyces sp. NBC_00481]WRZ00369.1 NAD(P)-binding domain-containing protein [Streptomyces sp. NBC_00481]